jgi:Domain of unknown function (DUF4105)
MKRVWSWFGEHPLRPAFLCMALIMALGASACVTGPPRNDRDWYPYLARTSAVQETPTSFAVEPVTDWSYDAAGPTAESYTSAAFNLDDLREIWFVLEPQPGSQLAAHTFLMFEFTDDRLIGLTIEARRERNEDYSVVAGAFNAFELSYLWGSARDLLTRRAVMLDHEVFIYPVDIPTEQDRTLLTRLVERTHALETQPRYYNTLFSNCTNELAKAAGFHWAPAYILTGRSDEYLYRRHIIPGASFEQAHRRSDMTQFIKAMNSVPAADFNRRILEELRRRQST